ncbi:MAG: hypothetical protein H0W93_07170 [Gammaproteobacteria bacterium]|nr:hypothetical protein [Gammaproteobacteria bacterium]
MSKPAPGLDDRAADRDVFARALERHSAGLRISRRYHREAAAKMLVVARKGIVRFRCVERAQLFERATITDVEQEESSHTRRESRQLCRLQ